MPGKSRRIRKRLTFTGITARFVMLSVAGLLVLSYLSVFINPASFWFITVFGLLFIPLATVNLFLLGWAVKRRSRSFIIPLLALVPSFFFIGSYVRVSGGESVGDVTGRDIKVVSYNVGRFMQGKAGSGQAARKACLDSVIAFLKSTDADIVCLQEFYLSDDADLKSLIGRKLKGYNAEYYMFDSRRGRSGNVTLSRFKAKDKGVIKFDGSANLAIYTDYRIRDEVLRVYNCHFESYNVSPSGLLRSLLQRDGKRLRDVEDKMRSGILRRPKQVSKVLGHIADSPVEAMVCGDFNDSPMSYTYFRMSRGRRDTFRQAGKGFSATFSLLWPLIRIDYVLYPKKFTAISHSTPRKTFSDHYPVVSEIRIDN
ncbi:MAG: endonuclease/exonuclease/phosphatase family protein [Bacteroidales bacterium]|nr:endonuclease/exonuclease/phosphatase family protein [Bacteroidales bacterium]